APGSASVTNLQYNELYNALEFSLNDVHPVRNYFQVEVFGLDTSDFSGFFEQLVFSSRDYSLELLGATNELLELPIDDPQGQYVFTT
ncbi:MAG: hypothetical protein ACPF9D_12200, partial [Owenweeksia sp.]